MDENKEAIVSLNFSQEKTDKLCKKLSLYRFVDEICDLHVGKYVRWLRKTDTVLKVGGIVVDIKFLDGGTHVVVYNKYLSKNPIQYKFDDVLTFQKLSEEEQLILLVQN